MREPEAFVITLMNQSGREITSLPRGGYEIRVSDPAVIHDFRVMGPGGLDQSTSVPEETETTWHVVAAYDHRADRMIARLWGPGRAGGNRWRGISDRLREQERGQL